MFQKRIINLLKKYTKLKTIQLEIPPSQELGDYAFPCFQLAKKEKKPPQEIAQNLQQIIKKPPYIEKIQSINSYLNFFINKTKLIKQTIKHINKQKNKYGSLNLGKRKKILLEHTSINPNASPHVGRARNAILGDSISKLLKFQNYNVETHFFVNDVGKQIALLVLACKKTPKFNQLLKIYINMNKKLKNNPKIESKVFRLLKKFEEGDKKTIKLFKKTVDICIKGQKKVFQQLNINYDFFDYESKYLFNNSTQKILEKLKKTNKIFVDKEKRIILDQSNFNLAMKTPYLVLTRADKTSLYPLRDLAYTIEKMKKTKNNIIILGEDQKLYFQQLKAALSLIKIPSPKVIHYSFVLLSEGKKMSTRKGNLVLLEDFIKEATQKAKKEIIKRHGNIRNLTKLSEIIANSSIKYTILKISPEKNVIFNLSKALSFEGNTGPYIQYTYARASSILKNSKTPIKPDYSNLTKQEEFNLVKKFSEFPSLVLKTSRQLKPHLIANYLYELSQQFNNFYHLYPVLKAPKKIKDARLTLVSSTKQIIKNGLTLLGIEAPERM